MGDVVEIIRARARWWADPDPYKVEGQDLQDIFRDAGCKLIPSDHDAEYSAKHLGSNCKLGSGNPVAWCGVFATSVLRFAGLDVYWDFAKYGSKGGGMVTKALGVGYLSAKTHLDDLSPGDVAVIPDNTHHFIVMDTFSDDTLLCIEGNTAGQMIRSTIRPLIEPNPKKRIQGFYHLYR
jgi:hypothetical protein